MTLYYSALWLESAVAVVNTTNYDSTDSHLYFGYCGWLLITYTTCHISMHAHFMGRDDSLLCLLGDFLKACIGMALHTLFHNAVL